MFENRLQYENCREYKYFENREKYCVAADVLLVWAGNHPVSGFSCHLPNLKMVDLCVFIQLTELIYSFWKNVCVFYFIFCDVDLLSTTIKTP